MGLWLKCPGCQENNPLAAQVCPACGRSLQNLPPGQRVYVVGPGRPVVPKSGADASEMAAPPGPATIPKAAPAAAPAPPVSPPEPTQPLKKGRKPRKKKG